MGSLIGGGISLIGNIGADRTANRSANEANRQRTLALQELMGIDIPDIELMKRAYEVPELVGEYTPEMEQLFAQDPSAMEGVAVDPRLASSQYAALQQLSGLAESGLSPEDIAGLEQVRRQSAAQDQARQGQILQEMQQRGVGGAGSELIAKLKSSQSAADRSSQEGLEIAKMAQQRALQAIMNQGNLASSMRNQDVGEQSNIARAKDVINQFNTANRQNVQQRNVGNQNVAQQQNLQNRQGIENQRANIRNLEQDVNKDLYQQRFKNERNKADSISNAVFSEFGVGNSIEKSGKDRSDRQRRTANSIGNMAGPMAGAIGGFF